MAYSLSLWKNDTWKRKAELALTGYPELDYAAAEGFSETNVGRGDTIFIVTNIKGTLYIGGSIVVESVVSLDDAAVCLGRPKESLWKSDGYVLARKGTIQKFIPNCEVPASITRQLQITKDKGFTYLKFTPNGKLDRQTLRTVRKLCDGSELHLIKVMREWLDGSNDALKGKAAA